MPTTPSGVERLSAFPRAAVEQAITAASFQHREESAGNGEVAHHDLEQLIEHAAHLLPSQGPIRVFVHHNTLHAFEHLHFDQAVVHGGTTYGCHPYLPEDRYRQKLSRGRILQEDLAAVLIQDLGDDGERLLGFL